MRIGGVLVALDGFPEQLLGLGGLAGPLQDHAQRERRIAETSIERDRAAQRDFGAIEVIPLFERDPEVVEGLGVVRLLAGDSVEARRPLPGLPGASAWREIQPAGSEGRMRRHELPNVSTASAPLPLCISASPRLLSASGTDGSSATARRRLAAAPSRSPRPWSATPSCRYACATVRRTRLRAAPRALESDPADAASCRGSSGPRHDPAGDGLPRARVRAHLRDRESTLVAPR